jgi:hypothetical protein
MNKTLFFGAVLVACSGQLMAEENNVEILRVSGVGDCVPYSATFSNDTKETLVEFKGKLFGKVAVKMINEEGFEKTTQAEPRGSLYRFTGSYSSVSIKVGKCSFGLTHAPQNKVSTHDKAMAQENLADEQRLQQIQKQIDTLMTSIAGDSSSVVPVAASQQALTEQVAKPLGQFAAPLPSKTTMAAPAKAESVSVVVEDKDWELSQLSGIRNPVVSWVFEKDRHSVLVTLEKGYGFDVMKATDKKGNNLYKGKINKAHRILIPYMSDDYALVEIRDVRSRKYEYKFSPKVVFAAAPTESTNFVQMVSGNVSSDMIKPHVDSVATERFAYIIKDSLRSTIDNWAKHDGWTIASYEGADVSFGASALLAANDFDQAMKQLATALLDSGVNFDLYPANKVLRITVKGKSGSTY